MPPRAYRRLIIGVGLARDEADARRECYFDEFYITAQNVRAPPPYLLPLPAGRQCRAFRATSAER